MVRFFDVRVEGLEKVQGYFNRILTRVPKAANRDTRNMSRDFRNGLIESLNQAGREHQPLKWTGKLRNELKVKKRGKLNWEITTPNYGIFLDSMRTHAVSIDRHPILRRWAREHLNKESGIITVRPHPWIAHGLRLGGKRAIKRARTGEIARVFRKGVVK